MSGQQKGVIGIARGALYELSGGGVSNPSAFSGAHLRLTNIKNRKMNEALAA